MFAFCGAVLAWEQTDSDTAKASFHVVVYCWGLINNSNGIRKMSNWI